MEKKFELDFLSNYHFLFKSISRGQLLQRQKLEISLTALWSKVFSHQEATLYEGVSVCWLVCGSVCSAFAVMLLLFGLLGSTFWLFICCYTLPSCHTLLTDPNRDRTLASSLSLPSSAFRGWFLILQGLSDDVYSIMKFYKKKNKKNKQ